MPAKCVPAYTKISIQKYYYNIARTNNSTF